MTETTDRYWTEARVSLLKELWTAGKSATEIAPILGGDITRNVVIGKVHRLRLEKRGHTGNGMKPKRPKPNPDRHGNSGQVRAKSIVKRAAARARVKPPIIEDVPDDLPDVTHLLGILDLTADTCKFPFGDPQHRDFHFCGAQPIEGKPYCPTHERIAHYKVAESRAAAAEHLAAKVAVGDRHFGAA